MSDPAEKLATYCDAVMQGFPSKVQEAYSMIGMPAFRLLALRGYVQAGDKIDNQWAWTPQEYAAFKSSAASGLLNLEIAKVQRTFAASNTGFHLTPSEVRYLPKQVSKWNENATVRMAATAFERRCLTEIAGYPEPPDDVAIAKFRQFLHAQHLDRKVPLAVPGLSDHGQMHAVDFVVVQDHKVVADASLGQIGLVWDAGPNWSAKLNDAVVGSGSRFDGPLPSPYEPWHYWLRH